MTAKKLYRKLHLWLSVPFGLFIALICFSGSMLVFEREITEMCCPELYFVEEVGGKPLPIDRLLEQVAAALPDSVSVTGVTIPSDAGRTWQVGLSKPRRASLQVDPYTGRIKGSTTRLPFYGTMFRLHRWMMGSSSGGGKMLVGISTLMLVVILITGLLMWLTNRNKPLTQSLKIGFTKSWPRFWHDLHVAGGIYATIFLLALALTGLTWSFSWYRTGFYRTFGVETTADGGHGTPQKTPPANGQQGTRGNRSDARTEHPDAAASRTSRRGEGGQSHENAGRPEQQAPHKHAPYAHWQEVYEHLAQAHPGHRQIVLSDGSASVVPAGRTSLRSGDRFDFDRQGRITSVTPYADQDKAAKVRSGVYTVHVGSWGGLTTRILTFLAALLGAMLPLTGYYLWIRRLVKRGSHRRDEA
ncbi:MAG: PepSY domain-containing protein [Alistipes sp.]|nr:PepSY domain-containing protein [Alistipes sp.]